MNFIACGWNLNKAVIKKQQRGMLVHSKKEWATDGCYNLKNPNVTWQINADQRLPVAEDRRKNWRNFLGWWKCSKTGSYITVNRTLNLLKMAELYIYNSCILWYVRYAIKKPGNTDRLLVHRITLGSCWAVSNQIGTYVCTAGCRHCTPRFIPNRDVSRCSSKSTFKSFHHHKNVETIHTIHIYWSR